MNNKINTTDKYDIFKIFTASILLAGFLIYCLISFFTSEFDSKAIINFIFDFALIALLIFLLIFFINKSYCRIYIEDGYIKRKGLLFGYKKEVKISEIKKVVLHNKNNAKFYYIIEHEEELNNPELFQECIHFIKGYDGHDEFLNSFWNDPIEDLYDVKNDSY